jgi:hypothetical protein
MKSRLMGVLCLLFATYLFAPIVKAGPDLPSSPQKAFNVPSDANRPENKKDEDEIPYTITNVTCKGAADGKVTIKDIEGIEFCLPFSWGLFKVGTPTPIAITTGKSFSGLAPGEYWIEILGGDCAGSPLGSSFFIEEPAAALGGTASATSISCGSTNDGAINFINVTGGWPGYEFSIDGGGAFQISPNFPNLTAKTYQPRIRDNSGCIRVLDDIILSQGGSTLTGSIFSQVNVNCFGQTIGSVTVKESLGTAPFQFSRNGGASWQSSGYFTGLAADNYTIIIRDATGCTFNVPVVITQPSALSASITSQTNVSCFGGNNGSATVTANGGTAGYTYSWSGGGGTSATASNLSQGTYTVTVTDANGCTTTATANITQPAVLSASITAQTNVSCFGGNNGSATVTANGGTAGYTYSWSGGGGTSAKAILARALIP